MAYSITIDGIDRTSDVLNQSIVIEDVINDKVNSCRFKLIDRSGSGIPETDAEIIIVLDDTDFKIFGGYITSITLSKKQSGAVSASIYCVDYTRLLDRNLVHKSYEDMTDAEIITDLVATYCPGFGITTNNVDEAITISQISFNYIQMSQALRQICDLTGRNWFIDYDKDVHYTLSENTVSGQDTLSDAEDWYIDMRVNKDASQMKNRVYVRGGTYLSDTTTYEEKGDGEKRKFVLPDKPHNVSISVNGAPETLGIKNVDVSGYDWYLNFQEKYIEQDGAGVTLTDTDTVAVSYKYDIPILVAVEEPSSITESGVHEFAIFDKTIRTIQAARDRASAELTDYANSMVDITLSTYLPYFRSGDAIDVDHDNYELDDSFVVQKIIAHSMGGGTFVYELSLASKKKMGIIRFLIELLEANKNLIELDDNEVVDELFSVSDSLLSDSLTDALTTDSTGAYFTWCTDSLDAAPITRARWDLYQWG